MQPSRHLKPILGLGITLVVLVILAIILIITESGLSIWQQLREAPDWFFYFYIGIVTFLAFGMGWLVWRLLMPRKKNRHIKTNSIPTEDEIQLRVTQVENSGIDVTVAQRELEKLAERRSSGDIYVATFGEISTGKSSLINALIPDAAVSTNVIGGTTLSVSYYTWQSTAGDRLVITDVPGTNEPGNDLTHIAQEEALRAHVVIYVCDGDLTQTQYKELQALLTLKKPTILALNKTDQYTDVELGLIREKLSTRLNQTSVNIISINAGGSKNVVRLYPDGREEIVTQPITPQVDELKKTLQRKIDNNMQALEHLRDCAVFSLITNKLDQVEAQHQEQQANKLVRQYTQKAIIGALAAVAPGTDIIVQGYLATRMVKELCSLYGIPVRNLDIEKFLDLSQAHLGKMLPLVLAIAGNGLKAFPGVGTLTGGILHAVAYGIIFDTLGRAVNQTLASRGELHAAPAAKIFKESLSENMETRAGRFIELALEAYRSDRPKS